MTKRGIGDELTNAYPRIKLATSSGFLTSKTDIRRATIPFLTAQRRKKFV
jgi:hypothetical protein